jgi:hypothetical protein
MTKEFEDTEAKKKKKLKCWEMYGCENKECPAYNREISDVG